MLLHWYQYVYLLLRLVMPMPVVMMMMMVVVIQYFSLLPDCLPYLSDEDPNIVRHVSLSVRGVGAALMLLLMLALVHGAEVHVAACALDLLRCVVRRQTRVEGHDKRLGRVGVRRHARELAVARPAN